MPAEQRFRTGGIQQAAALLARLGGTVLRGAAHAGQPREPAIEFIYRRFHASADVRNAGDVVGHYRPRDCVGDVADIDVVACLLTVTIHDARHAREQPRRKDRDHTGLTSGILARTVDVRQS
jgi:hypothetical protein